MDKRTLKMICESCAGTLLALGLIVGIDRILDCVDKIKAINSADEVTEIAK